MEQTTILLGLVLAGVIVFYLLLNKSFRSATKQTVIIPKKTYNTLRSSSRNDKNEVVVKLDYEQGSSNPKKQIWRRGSNGSVSPGIINNEEVIVHIHPKVRSGSKIQDSYENELRERPSYTDLQFSKRKGKELLVTPSGRLIEFDAEQANLGKIKNLDYAVQVKAQRQIPPRNTKQAHSSAKLSNKMFIEESRRAGVKYINYDTNKRIKLRTEVK